MHRLRSLYGGISFRRRLLLLLVLVSLVQASVAAYTFFELQAEPSRQRVHAQLNAALRGAAPVVDAELQRASAQLQQLTNDPALQAAIEAEDWDTAGSLLEVGDDAEEIAFDEFAESVVAESGFEEVDGSEEQPAQPEALAAFVTDASGEVVAGTRPDATLVDQRGVTSTRLLRDAKLLATVHVPVAVDREFLAERVEGYVPRGVEVFVADDETISATGSDPTARPRGLREGLHEMQLDGERRLVLAQPLLDGSVLVGASVPAAEAAAQQRQGMSSLWGFIVLLAVLMVGMSWVITRAVGDALRRFAQIARDLADGRLDRRIPVTGDDEIAMLSTSFNDMAEHLEDRIERLVDARARLRRQVDLFGEALANATDVSEMLQAVCSLAMESTGATRGRFWTLDEDGRYEHAACIGLRPGDAEPSELEKVVPVRNAPVRAPGAVHWLVVPARLRDGQTVGLLTLVSTGDAFDDDDVRIAERIALQAGVALDNARMHEQLRLQATRDGLTGLPNHRSLQDELTRRLEEAYAADMPLGVAMLDIDNFKRVNDTWGHPVGDEAIKAIGATLAQGVGGLGTVGRYGGEEFVIIMPGCDADAAVRIADRLREDITHIRIPLDDGTTLQVTSSFGVANVDQQHEAQVGNAELLHQADIGLYNAKRTGKNRVQLAGPDTVLIEMSEAERRNLEARERGDSSPDTDGPGAPPAADYFDVAA